MSSIGTSADVIGFLTAQHRQIERLFARVADGSGAQREQAFTDLRRLLAVHETAEEEVVHPRARQSLVNGDVVVAARLHEERAGKQALAELEQLELGSAEFDTAFAALREDVLAHAGAEEREEFAQLAEAIDETQLQRMRRAAELAERTAPTHPHAGVEYAGENLLVGPFAAMLDRAKDVITGRR